MSGSVLLILGFAYSGRSDSNTAPVGSCLRSVQSLAITSHLLQSNSQSPHSCLQDPSWSVYLVSLFSGHSALLTILPVCQSQSALGTSQLPSPSPRNTPPLLQSFIPKSLAQEHLPCLPYLNLHNSPGHFQSPLPASFSLAFFANILCFSCLLSVSPLRYKFHQNRDFVCFLHCQWKVYSI